MIRGTSWIGVGLALVLATWLAGAANGDRPLPIGERGAVASVPDPDSPASSDTVVSPKRIRREASPSACRRPRDVRVLEQKLSVNAPARTLRTPAAPPLNDSCASPTVVEFDDPEAVSGTFDFDNSEATDDGLDHEACIDPDVDPLGKIARDVWFCWTATCTGPVEVSTCSGTEVDTKIAVYEGCTVCPPTDDQLSPFGCNDDYPPECGLQSSVSFLAQSGQDYMIRIGSYPGSQSFPPAPGGTGTFTITCTDLPCDQDMSLDGSQPFTRYGGGSLSDRTNVRAADDFTPSATGEISALCWWGSYEFFLPSDDTFEVQFYADAAGLPDEANPIAGPFRQSTGSLIVSPPVDTATGNDWPIYEYSATIPGACSVSETPCSVETQDCKDVCELSHQECESDEDCFLVEDDTCSIVQTCESQAVAVTAGECYWLEISNGTGNFWYWQDGAGGDISSLLDEMETVPSTYDAGDRWPTDQAFVFDVAIQSCNPSPCDGATGDCCELHTPPGCEDPDCCKQVCACDPICCTEGSNWDSACAGEGYQGSGCGAANLCAQYCAACPDGPGPIQWLDPRGDPLLAGGIVDARQPHPVNDVGTLQGLDTFVAQAPIGAGFSCWTAHECVSGGGGNVPIGVRNVTDHGDGTHTIELERPVSPGALAQLTYTTDLAATHTGNYAFLPGDVNGDRTTAADDIDDLIGCINGLACEAWQVDINRGGAANSQDLLRLIDLLNGADGFEVWLSQTVPSGCP